MDDFETPSELARELGVSPTTIRNYLRDQYGLLESQGETRWRLDAPHAADVRKHFSGIPL